MPVRLTQEEFLDRLPEDIKFKPTEQIPNTKDPTNWVCDKGHQFRVPLRNLIRRPHCPECHPAIPNKKYTLDDVKTLAEENGYLFLDDKYKGNKYDHNVQCVECGAIQTKRINSISRGVGCPHCSGQRKLTWEIVRDKAAEKGIEVPKCEIVNSKTKITVFCTATDVFHMYQATPGHIMLGIGCPFCADRYQLTVSDVNERLADRSVKFRLISEDYKNNKTYYPFECKECGYVVESTYNRMWKRSTCPVCDPRMAYAEFPDKPHLLYYLRVDTEDGPLYKVGITSKDSVNKRFSSKGDLDKITVLRTLEFDTGQKAFDLEQYYLRLFHEHRYQGPPILKSGGSTELFYTDVLGLDKSNLDTQPKAS